MRSMYEGSDYNNGTYDLSFCVWTAKCLVRGISLGAIFRKLISLIQCLTIRMALSSFGVGVGPLPFVIR